MVFLGTSIKRWGALVALFFLASMAAQAGALIANEHQKTERHVIIFLGPPGSGKGTQAEKLARDLNLPHISTGDLFRENIANKTDLGKRAKGFIDQGQLVPDSLVNDMLFERISKDDAKSGYILDGYPRKITQAEAFYEKIGKDEKVTVINLKVSDEEVIKRLSGRLICTDCGNISHLEFSPPLEEGVCDLCHGELIQRDDDKPEVIKHRLEVYHAQTEPLISFFEDLGVLKNIEGEESSDAVFESIRKAVN